MNYFGRIELDQGYLFEVITEGFVNLMKLKWFASERM